MLFLDVDGVLVLRGEPRDGYVEHEVCFRAGTTEAILVNPGHRPWIGSLARHFDVVWATGWELEAPRLLAPLLDLPDFPVIEFTERPSPGSRIAKLRDIAARVGDRRAAWVDDDFEEDVWPWAERRPWPTLLIRPETTRGLQPEHVEALLRFADGQGESNA